MKKHDIEELTAQEVYMIVCGLQWLGLEGCNLADRIRKQFREKYDRGAVQGPPGTDCPDGLTSDRG